VAVARASALSFVRKKSINARSEARFCRRLGSTRKTRRTVAASTVLPATISVNTGSTDIEDDVRVLCKEPARSAARRTARPCVQYPPYVDTYAATGKCCREIQSAIGKISGMFRSAPHSPPLCPCACPNTIRVYSCLVLSLHAYIRCRQMP
jgi:hypothetical protein